MTALQALLCSTRNDVGPASGQLAENVLGMPEELFIARLRRDDESAFETMYRAFHPRLVAIATAYVDKSAAEEIVQDLLLYVWEHRKDWSPQHGVAVYLYASARNRALKQLRHQGIVARLEHVAQAEVQEQVSSNQAADTPYDVTERADLIKHVDAALARLPELGRTAFMLRWVHQLGYPEISQIMGLSEVAVRKQVSRAREALVKVLK